MRIRNPWGYGEWMLKWSENPDHIDLLDKWMPWLNAYYDKEIEEAKKNREEPPEKYVLNEDDGTFMMCFKDWRTVYCNLFMCVKFPEEWSGMRLM